MPLSPKHAASFKGNLRKFDVAPQRQQQGKIRIMCHSNMYIGQLRTKVAGKLNYEPARLRLFANGEPVDYLYSLKIFS